MDNIVLIVNGVLVRDDGNVIGHIYAKVQALMDAGIELAQTVADFNASVTALIDDITALLNQPQPNITAAVTSLTEMRERVDAMDAKVQDVLTPPLP